MDNHTTPWRRPTHRRHRRLAGLLLSAALALLVGALTAPAAVAVTCSSAPQPTSTRPGTVLVTDTFESGSLSRWAVRDEGDAWAGITTSAPRSGSCAGRLVVTSSSTSMAHLRRYTPSGTADVWARGWFRVDRQGYVGSNVPTFRFFNGSQRILDVFRANGTGQLWIRSASGSGSWRYVWLNRYMELHRWYQVEIHVRSAWSESIVSVYVNGTLLYGNSRYYLPASRVTTVQIGAEHYRQVSDLSFDDIIVKVS